MPYVPDADRPHAAFVPTTPGELNFAITLIVLGYVAREGARYTSYNDALGALEGAKLELYRRRIAPYEDGKIAENGDVY